MKKKKREKKEYFGERLYYMYGEGSGRFSGTLSARARGVRCGMGVDGKRTLPIMAPPKTGTHRIELDFAESMENGMGS